MTGTIPTVREIVIVITDLYLPAGSAEAEAASDTGSPGTSSSASQASFTNAAGGSSLVSPGLERIARFGHRRALDHEGGWRAWLARWIGREDLANVSPAVIAATWASRQPAVDAAAESVGVQDPRVSPPQGEGAADPGVSSTQGAVPRGAVAQDPAVSSTIWFAAPIHLIAGLTSLHLDRRSLLQLS